MRTGMYKKLIAIILIISSATSLSALEKKDEKLDISGLFRTRGWYTASEIYVPGRFPASDSYRSVDYIDLFFRSRINFAADESITVKSVFDVASSFGMKQFSMGNMGTNLVTRNLYAEFRFSDESQFSAGLMPFSLTGGHILARDATGFTYRKKMMSGRLDIYASWIRAYDAADSAYGKDMEKAEYASDNIYYAGAKFNPTAEISSEIYCVFEYDKYTEINKDDRETTLFWAGTHNRYESGRMMLSAGVIYNQGKIYYPGVPETTIRALLAELGGGYRFEAAEVTAAVEGATGSPVDSNASNSFQAIKASRGFSMIAVDNDGGVAVRGSGISPWHGLMGYSLKAKRTLLEIMILEIRIAQFMTTGKPADNSARFSRFGEELNIKADFPIRETGSFFICSAAFLPGDAYREIYGHDRYTPVIEVMAGTQINF
jgi:hypothetical protein